jgi:E3 SUMO-protein ligase PIAS1
MWFYELSYSYFDQILKDTSEDVDDIIVEANGQWHTTDNKYASAEWRSSHPLPPGSSPLSQKSLSSIKNHTGSPTDGEHPVKRGSEILILDSDDEDEGRVKRELSPSLASIGRSTSGYLPTRSHPNTVIDLTLDSEDDSPPPTSQASSQKRKGAGGEMPHRSSSKRPRGEDNDVIMRAMAMRTINNNNVSSSSNQNTTARDHVPHFNQQTAPHTPRYVATTQSRFPPRYDRPAAYPSFPSTARLSPSPRGNVRPSGTSSSALQHRAWH